MSNIKKLKDNEDKDIFPVSIENAIFDSNGISLAEKMNNTVFLDEILADSDFELGFAMASRLSVLEQKILNMEHDNQYLKTNNKTIVGAINEVFDKSKDSSQVGTLNDLNTQNKNNIVAAINELNEKINSFQGTSDEFKLLIIKDCNDILGV